MNVRLGVIASGQKLTNTVTPVGGSSLSDGSGSLPVRFLDRAQSRMLDLLRTENCTLIDDKPVQQIEVSHGGLNLTFDCIFWRKSKNSKWEEGSSGLR